MFSWEVAGVVAVIGDLVADSSLYVDILL